MTRASLLAVALPLALALPLAACDGSARQEADSVVRATERFRRAENAEKPAVIHDLRATRCSAADVCRARKECLAYAEPTVQALLLKTEVQNGLGRLEKDAMAKDSDEAKALPQKLDDAQRLLKEGIDHLDACDREIQALRRAHRL